MNKQLEQFKKLEKQLTFPKLNKPKEFEVEKCIDALRKRLKETDLPEPVKIGYTWAVTVIEKRITKYEDFDFNILVSYPDQSRAIVMLAIDFLNGECSKKVLCDISKKE